MADRYRAFISYSHADESWAAWLHRRLERYRVPRRLRRDHPELPARLSPVFRDRDELASSSDLGDSVRSALQRSDTLIVVCSPKAAASRWVGEEIRSFRELAPTGQILCMMVDGSPLPDDEDCAFPPALLTDDEGNSLPEPLAADVRNDADGRRSAFLKIAAGLLGVGIDDLKRRDHQRWVRTLSAIAGGAVAVAILTIGLAINAHIARQEADLRRTQAENLIEFMLVELRGKLEPIGKLDVLDAVGDEAMEYFAAVGDLGTDEEVLARAMALRQIGEVRFHQGRLQPALEAFTESRDITRALYEASQGNNDILFELGQAEFWVGYVAWERNDLQAAKLAWSAYGDVSLRLARRDAGNRDYALERAYAAMNLGSIARESGDPATARDFFSEAVSINEELLAASPQDVDLMFVLAEGLSWLGSALLDLGELASSENALQRSYDLLESLDRRGAHSKHSEAFGDVAAVLTEVKAHRGEVERALETVNQGIATFGRLVSQDPDNARWQAGLARLSHIKAHLLVSIDQHEDAGPVLRQAHRGFLSLVQRDPSNTDLQQRLARTEVIVARLELGAGRFQLANDRAIAARSRSDQALNKGSVSKKQAKLAVEVRDIQGVVLAALGEHAKAESAWRDGVQLLAPLNRPDPINRALYVRLMTQLGQFDKARSVKIKLETIGFRDPRYAASPAEF